jgi:hypothetical protein
VKIMKAALLSSALFSATAGASDEPKVKPLLPVAHDHSQHSATPTNQSNESAMAPAASSAAPVTTKENVVASALQARTPEEQARQSGFIFAVGLDHSLGAGTFVDSSKYSYMAGSLGLSAMYNFGVGNTRLVASGTWRALLEYTLPDVETGRRVSWVDARFGLAAPAFFRDTKLTGISVTPSIGVTIPSSPESWNAGLITNLSAGLTFTRSIKTVDFRAVLSGSHGFFTSTQNGVRASTARDTSGNLLMLCRPGETICGFGGWNTAWSMVAGGSVSWRLPANFVLYASYSYMRFWRYAATDEVDAYTAKALDKNGNPVAKVGFGQGDRTMASFGGSYQLSQQYSLDLGVSTAQTPLTPTGQVRFPFLGLGTWADNTTTLFFSLTAAY